jgi:hypothetical protein
VSAQNFSRVVFLARFRLPWRGFCCEVIWGDFHNLAITPNVDWQALASVLLNRFLDCRLECDQAALRNRQFANVSGNFSYSFP